MPKPICYMCGRPEWTMLIVNGKRACRPRCVQAIVSMSVYTGLFTFPGVFSMEKWLEGAELGNPYGPEASDA